MILDGNLMFDGNATTNTFDAITVTRDSTNVLDMGILGQTGNGRDMGIGTPLYLMILSNRAFAGGTNVQIAFQGAPDNGSGAEGTYVTYAGTGALVIASLNAQPGFLFRIDVPRPSFGQPIPRFYKLVYTVSGTFTTGGVIAGLVNVRDDVVYYPSALNTSGI